MRGNDESRAHHKTHPQHSPYHVRQSDNTPKKRPCKKPVPHKRQRLGSDAGCATTASCMKPRGLFGVLNEWLIQDILHDLGPKKERLTMISPSFSNKADSGKHHLFDWRCLTSGRGAGQGTIQLTHGVVNQSIIKQNGAVWR